MSKFLHFFSTVALLLLATLLAWFFSPLSVQKESFVSPLPQFLTRSSNNQVTTLDIWFPLVKFIEANFSGPDITGKSAISYDLTTNKELFAKEPSVKLPLASLTKIMTAIVALEHPKQDNNYVVTSQDLVGEDSMGLDAGEALSLQELLYGLILHSGNDTAEVLASNFPGGRDSFITAMNEKAKALGLQNTHFTNPTGLEGDGNQYTTAADLLAITKFALDSFPIFNDVVQTFDYTIPATSTHKAYYLENETNLLTSYPGVKGVKTGYTPEAGLCLVTYLEYGGHRIIAVLLGSENRRDEMKEILDYSLKKIGTIPPPHG